MNDIVLGDVVATIFLVTLGTSMIALNRTLTEFLFDSNGFFLRAWAVLAGGLLILLSVYFFLVQ